MKKSLIVVVLIITASLLTACGAKANVPEDVATAANENWGYYTWSENLGGDMWRGGGWHLAEADKSKSFKISKAMQGKIPDELKIMMSMGMSSYTDSVWCLNIEPTLYFGYGSEVNESLASKNLLMFESSSGQWVDLGLVWKQPWVNFLYPPNTYQNTTNFYMGVEKSMFEMMGCDNWQEWRILNDN